MNKLIASLLITVSSIASAQYCTPDAVKQALAEQQQMWAQARQGHLFVAPNADMQAARDKQIYLQTIGKQQALCEAELRYKQMQSQQFAADRPLAEKIFVDKINSIVLHRAPLYTKEQQDWADSVLRQTN